MNEQTKAVKTEIMNLTGLKVNVSFIKTGSLKNNYRVYSRDIKWWGNEKLIEQLSLAGYVDFDNKPLSNYSGNGGLFSIFIKKK